MNFAAYASRPTVASATTVYSLAHTKRLGGSAPLKRRDGEFRGQYPLVRDGSATLWAQMAHVGTWKGHWSGTEFTFTPDTLASFVRNFDASPNALPVRYGHTDDTVGAAGWIQAMRIEGDWICGLIELTDRAAKHVRDGEYRFTSIEFDMVCADPVTGADTGPTMFGLALTHTPFLRGQTPLSLG